jgi:addiction module RelB/DinJ family antitoxin
MKTSLSLKIDSDIKKSAQALAADFGIPLSTLINLYLKDLVLKKEINFSRSKQMTSYLENILEKVEEDISENKNLSQQFKTTKEALNFLDK